MSSSLSTACSTRARANKLDSKWLCPKCGGDVRQPAALSVTLETTPSSITKEKIQSSMCVTRNLATVSVNSSHSTEPFVLCALECSSPRYHLSCAELPACSQIYRSVFSSSLPASDNNNNHEQNIHSSLEAAWWELSSNSKSKVCSYKTLQKDRSWSTSMLSFICPMCDVEGTSRYLAEYFEQFNAVKKSFYKRYLSEISKCKVGRRLERSDECVEARTGEAFLWHLMQITRKEYLQPNTPSDMNWNSSEIKLDNMSSVLAYLSKQMQHTPLQLYQRRQKRQRVGFQLDPSYLVGMPIRFFNPIDKSYHTGRILDYKVDAPYRVDAPISWSNQHNSATDFTAPDISKLTDEKISRTLFFVRFRQGIEGRKIAVHEWIYLEEHAVAVGGEICWGKVGYDDRDIREDYERMTDKTAHGELCCYRPVQIIFRSLLEMIPVQAINSCPLLDDRVKPYLSLTVLGMGFGKAFSHVRLTLNDLSIDENTLSESASVLIPDDSENDKKMMPVAIPLMANNPTWLDEMLQRAELYDEDVALGLAIAHVEKEEERRVRERQNLSVSRLCQPLFDLK